MKMNMKVHDFSLHRYEIPFNNNKTRLGTLISVSNEQGHKAWGDVAPLPGWSLESLEESVSQLEQKKQAILAVVWTEQTVFQELENLDLMPSALFGLESALLSHLCPLPPHKVPISALLMGSPAEIMEQAQRRKRERFTFAKLKVSQLEFQEAADLIDVLKDPFRLRIDVNRAWSTSDSLRFFSRFPLDAFDYVEEPFQNPKDLALFTHPLAIDESFPKDLSLQELEALPLLKALIYKPTLQGGMTGCLPLYDWAKKKGIALVLSSSFESDMGLTHIASMAHRLSLDLPAGLGTYYYLGQYLCAPALRVFAGELHIPSSVDIK